MWRKRFKQGRKTYSDFISRIELSKLLKRTYFDNESYILDVIGYGLDVELLRGNYSDSYDSIKEYISDSDYPFSYEQYVIEEHLHEVLERVNSKKLIKEKTEENIYCGLISLNDDLDIFSMKKENYFLILENINFTQ